MIDVRARYSRQTVRFTDVMDQAIRDAARKRRVSPSQWIREAVAMRLAKEQA